MTPGNENDCVLISQLDDKAHEGRDGSCHFYCLIPSSWCSSWSAYIRVCHKWMETYRKNWKTSFTFLKYHSLEFLKKAEPTRLHRPAACVVAWGPGCHALLSLSWNAFNKRCHKVCTWSCLNLSRTFPVIFINKVEHFLTSSWGTHMTWRQVYLTPPSKVPLSY